MSNLRPSIYDYTDYRLFLKSSYEYEKSNGDFSYSVFAERAGFQSRSYLRTVITGKRNLTANAIAKIIFGFKLDLREGEAFRALVHFNQCQKFEEKHHYWELFLKQRPKKNNFLCADEYHYLARMAYPIMLVILKQKNIVNDVNELSRLTNLSISEVEEGLKTLVKINALTKTEAGEYQTHDYVLRTKDDVANVAVQKFHANILEKAKQALDLPTSKREFQSLMLALSESEFAQLKQRLKDFMDDVEEHFSGSKEKSEKVYSVHLNLVPITPDFIRNEKSNTSQKSVNENPVSMTLKETFT
jgi:uncharacterized protein (TIGR02147 family)